MLLVLSTLSPRRALRDGWSEMLYNKVWTETQWYTMETHFELVTQMNVTKNHGSRLQKYWLLLGRRSIVHMGYKELSQGGETYSDATLWTDGVYRGTAKLIGAVFES